MASQVPGSVQPNQDPRGTLETALAHTEFLLDVDPRLADEQAREILRVVPGQPKALLLRATATRRCGRAADAVGLVAPLLAQFPFWGAAHLEMGLVRAALGESAQALDTLRKAVKLDSELTHGWRHLGDMLTLAGDLAAADEAYAHHIRTAVQDPRLREAAIALCDGKLAVSEAILRDYLKRQPTDVAAIRMLAEIGARLARYQDAENLLARCLELAPSFTAARHNYATVLYRSNKAAEAISQLDVLLKHDPQNPSYRNLKAAASGRIGEFAQAIDLYEDVLKEYPNQPKGWMSYGHALKTVGRQDDSIQAYWHSIELMPGLGEAYWSLANLKTFRFSAEQIAEMEAQLRRDDLADEDQFHLHYALGKAYEDSADYALSFAHYAQGAAKRRQDVDYDPEETRNQVARAKSVLTAEFFAKSAGQGCISRDPIFIVGLPRAGSTLIEQILSSHSQVEGTQELPDIISMAKRLGGKRKRHDETAYPDCLAELSESELRTLGAEYLERTQVQRKTERPHFIDKMPNNWAHVGFIHLILPNAKIIDARRHPLGCCFSGFKQHFARGQNFSYELTEIGRYYHDYVELMAHMDFVLPGRIHRVFYEQMVADTEAHVRALLAYCGLPFEEACLRFYETERAVRTASSEQVRRPIFTEGVDQWRHYEPWLEPLKAALGQVLDVYPDVPAFG
jgi:tetratricopeptide (TPR) repeat protein